MGLVCSLKISDCFVHYYLLYSALNKLFFHPLPK